MKVYHGGYTKVREIDLKKCRAGRDFGQAFYLSNSRFHAEECARQRIEGVTGGKKIATDNLEMSGMIFCIGNTPVQEEDDSEQWKIARKNGSKGVITEFDFNEEAFNDKSLEIIRFEAYTEDWLNFVIFNRIYAVVHGWRHKFDIVEGPIAEDKVIRRVYAHVFGLTTWEQAVEELKAFPYTHQIALCTEKALKMVEFIG